MFFVNDFAGIVNSVYSLFPSCSFLSVFTTSVDGKNERVDKRDDVGRLDEWDNVERVDGEVDEQKDEWRLNEWVRDKQTDLMCPGFSQ